MTFVRFGLALSLALGACGCVAGGPDRASDIQNLNAITDDISAVTMTQSENLRSRDPNTHSTIPRTYEINEFDRACAGGIAGPRRAEPAEKCNRLLIGASR